MFMHTLTFNFPGGSDGKVSCLQCGRPGFDPWVRKILWRRKWQPTPVLLPGKSHGQRSIVGYSPWGHKELDMTEWFHFLTFNINFVYILIYACTHTQTYYISIFVVVQLLSPVRLFAPPQTIAPQVPLSMGFPR